MGVGVSRDHVSPEVVLSEKNVYPCVTKITGVFIRQHGPWKQEQLVPFSKDCQWKEYNTLEYFILIWNLFSLFSLYPSLCCCLSSVTFIYVINAMFLPLSNGLIVFDLLFDSVQITTISACDMFRLVIWMECLSVVILIIYNDLVYP